MGTARSSHVLIKLKVHPGSKKNLISRRAEDSFEIWVKAPAREGLANQAALALLSIELRQPVNKLRIIKGSTSPSKIVKVWEAPPPQVP